MANRISSLLFPLVALVALVAACGSSESNGEAAPDGAGGSRAEQGPCGSAAAVCEIDQCWDGKCSLIELARLPGPLRSIRATSTQVYVIAEGGGAIYSVPNCGGRAVLVARSIEPINDLVYAWGQVYWYTGDVYTGVFYRTPQSGGTSSLALSNGDKLGSAPSGLAADDEAVYFGHGSPPGLLRLDADGSETNLRDLGLAGPLLVDRSYVYFQQRFGETVSRIGKEGSDESVVSELPTNGDLRAADDDWLYAVAYVNAQNEVLRIAKRGGESETIHVLSSNISAANVSLASDGRCVYLAMQAGADSHACVRFTTTGGSVERLFESESGLTVALTEDSVYLATVTGSLFRRPK
jgi:hypothetical protein